MPLQSFTWIQTQTGCTKDLLTSDHSPVFATFQVGGVKQYAPSGPGRRLCVDVSVWCV